MFALIDTNSRVCQLAAETFPVAAPIEWTGDISSLTPAPQEGWTATKAAGGSWSFSPPVTPAGAPPTLAQQAAALLAAGLTISSDVGLSGTYACDPATQNHVQAEIVSLLVNGAFADGGSTVAWPDKSGATHSFTVAQFKAFATALAAFVAGCSKVVNGVSTTLPAATATIS